MIEIERKFRLTPEKYEAIEQLFRDRFGDPQPVHQSDQVFLQGLTSFEGFKRGMPVARLRTTDGKAELAYKRALNDDGDTLEHELAIGSAETMQQILEELGFRQVTSVTKDRLQVKEGELTMVLDQVAGLGAFLELEILSGEQDSGAAEATILVKAAEFGLTAADIEKKKYDQLVDAPSS